MLGPERFGDLARPPVDTDRKCRAWGGEATQHGLDAVPSECTGVRERAEALLAVEAASYLGIEEVLLRCYDDHPSSC